MTLSEQLEQLDELHRRGVLTDEEFARAKSRTLTQPGTSGNGLAALNGLQRSATDRWLVGVCTTGAVMSILVDAVDAEDVTGVCTTGAVISSLRSPLFLPKM